MTRDPPLHCPLRTVPGAVLALAALSLAIGATGCTTVPPPLRGDWPSASPNETSAGRMDGRVRWGGRLVDMQADGARTCLRLIAQPLAPNGRPNGSRTSLGRFVACRDGVLPEERFRPNREITVTGRIAGSAGWGDGAQVPRVDADAVVLWPRR